MEDVELEDLDAELGDEEPADEHSDTPEEG